MLAGRKTDPGTSRRRSASPNLLEHDLFGGRPVGYAEITGAVKTGPYYGWGQFSHPSHRTQRAIVVSDETFSSGQQQPKLSSLNELFLDRPSMLMVTRIRCCHQGGAFRTCESKRLRLH